MLKIFFKKILIILIFLSFLPIVNSNWYGDHTERFDNVSNIKTQGVKTGENITFCDEDGELDGDGIKGNYLPSWVPEHIKRLSRAPSYDGSATPMKGGTAYNTWDAPGGNGYYITQSRATSKGSGFKRSSMICQMWDGTNPWIEKIDYHNGWTNNKDIKITVVAKDYGGSKIDFNQLEIQQITSTNGPGFDDLQTNTNWKNSNISSRNIINSNTAEIIIKAPPTPGTAYKFRTRVRDRAGNISKINNNGDEWLDSNNIYKLDTEPPKIDNLKVGVDSNNNSNPDDNEGTESNTGNFGGNFQAGDEKPIILTYKNSDGSPIKIDYESENDGNPLIFDKNYTTENNYQFKLPDRYTKVDNDRNSNSGGRQVTVRLKQITDEAGNVTKLNKNYNFNVFANIGKIKEVNNENNSSNKYIADGQKNFYTQKLTDIYGNAIISSNVIGRTITRYSQASENKMYLNQQTRTGLTSVYLNDNNSTNIKPLPFDNTEINWGNQKSSDGVYRLGIAVYTPTKNSYEGTEFQVSDNEARFSLNTWLVIRDNQTKIKSVPEVRIKNFDINNPKYKPIFTSSFIGDIKDGGFIEGTTQNSKIEIKKEATSATLSSEKFILLYSGSQAPKFDLFLGKTNILPSGENYIFEKNFNSPKGIETLLKQKSDTVGDVSKLQLSSHFNYTLDGKNILYNGAIIGKNHYHDNNEQEVASQVGVKIIGLSNDKYLRNLLNGQHEGSDSIVIKSMIANDLYNSITKSIALTTRNIPLQDTSKTINNFDLSFGSDVKAGIVNNSRGKVLYVEANGQNIELSNSNDFAVSGINTIVVRGGNLYINSDMYYNDNDNASILGVVVQKDNNGNGGNLYINPKVTNIVGSYILDGSVISYDGSSEISIGQIHKLKNQLHIFGSILSHNTIGGSRSNPVSCPIIAKCSDFREAQKYDLNYLRRYYIYQGKPFGGGKVIGGGIVNESGNVVSSNTNLISKFSDINNDLAKYPVIIEYNSNILTNPPIGFDIYQE